ncbi:matrixin family metalloprotease [Geitlerinema sp. PCC 9228]|jgi:predicted Zn-dependent protease|uniref:matrixin family metalloprotease n=1 Tax=Geitlerinema sp. PCC 9228 TaxID=111611 RepID=UPI000A032B14|nr:matrixin family metalloprotease [Geitlerinema sp. PCC 9228]
MRKSWQRLVAGMLASMLAIAWWGSSGASQSLSDRSLQHHPAQITQFPLRSHPLPSHLAAIASSNSAGDYFDKIQTTKVGYLIWSQFPVSIYVAASATETSDRPWQQAVRAAIADWQAYFPLTLAERAENADIRIWNRRPPLELDEQGRLVRARAGQVQYELDLKSTADPPILSHRCDIFLNPHQAPSYLRATIRHELGHALGIWGHSPIETDTMYFSQVQKPAPISQRDLNTLRRIYQQPTRLGWPAQS